MWETIITKPKNFPVFRMSVHHTEVVENPEKGPRKTNISECSWALEYTFMVIVNIVLDYLIIF